MNALITWLIMHWSHAWSFTDHETAHALITWLIMHWSHGLIIHWSRECACTDHVAAHAMISWLIIHWSLAWPSFHYYAVWYFILNVFLKVSCIPGSLTSRLFPSSSLCLAHFSSVFVPITIWFSKLVDCRQVLFFLHKINTHTHSTSITSLNLFSRKALLLPLL